MSTKYTLARYRREGEEASGPAIHVGKTALATSLGLSPEFFAPDHWAVWRVGQNVILSGGDTKSNEHPVSQAHLPFGTLYAAYEFIERALGVRWYWPGKLGRLAPRGKSVSLGRVCWHGAPSYQTRFCFYPVHDDPEFSKVEVYAWCRWMRWGGIGGSAIGNHSFNHWSEQYDDERPELFALQRDGSRANKQHRKADRSTLPPESSVQRDRDYRVSTAKGSSSSCASVLCHYTGMISRANKRESCPCQP